ncbi:MAG: hypothetical protein HOP28_12850 [Gemmatimonadales bacterium]|nr:hypothetical protein [Gemmatimonadales bacterium]
MHDVPLIDRLAELNRAIQATAPIGADGQDAVPNLEELKRGLDDMRLSLWGRLQAAHTDDVRGFEEKFRIRRATELCVRLTADLKAQLMNPAHAEFADLWIGVVELGKTIQAAREREGVKHP